MEPKKIVFITWDGTDSNYLENLFAPIFEELKRAYNFDIYIIQFSWLSKNEIATRQTNMLNYGFHYLYLPIKLTPLSGITKFFGLLSYRNLVQNYIESNNIEYIMPRSTMPGLLTLLLKLKNRKIIFDADGLPLIERVEFSGLKMSSVQYKLLNKIEEKIIEKAQSIITRSRFASSYLSKKYKKDLSFFHEVVNGKDTKKFLFSDECRNTLRKKLNILPNDVVFIYCGSLGEKYRLDEMFNIYKNYYLQNTNSHFIILSRNIVPDHIQKHKNVLVLQADNNDVPKFLSAADIGLGLIQETTSMQAAAAIKYSEYLLCGLPTILSNIGSILQITNNQTFVLHYTKNTKSADIYSFVQQNLLINRSQISKFASEYFSITNAAKSYFNSICLNK